MFFIAITLVSCGKTVVDYYQIGFETNGGTAIENVVLNQTIFFEHRVKPFVLG